MSETELERARAAVREFCTEEKLAMLEEVLRSLVEIEYDTDT